MFKSMTPSTEATWPYAAPSPLSRLVAGIGRYRASLAEHRRVRRAMGELERLDDRMLRDIGVTRGEIGRVVRFGRGS